MSVPAEKWHKTLQYEGGDVTGIPGEFRYPGHGDGRVFIPAISVREAPSEHEVLTALRLAEEGVDVLFRIDSREEGVKNPDVEMNQQVWELKAPTGQGKNTVDSQMKRAGNRLNAWSSIYAVANSTIRNRSGMSGKVCRVAILPK